MSINKKIPVIILAVILFVGISTVIVFSTETKKQTILTGEKVNLEISILYNKEKNLKTSNLTNMQKEEISNLIDNSLVTKLTNGQTINISKMDITSYQDNVNSENIIKLSDDNIILEVNNDTGKIISIQNKKKNFSKCELNRENILLKATEIFNSLNIDETEKYKLTFIEEFDDEIWRTGFAKEYDGLINNGESVRFSFAPQTKEIVTLAINSTEFANNPKTITEDKALEIAKKVVGDNFKNLETKVSVEIVSPNYQYYKGKLGTNEIYKKIDTMRRAYVFKFLDKHRTQVYVDCTTGEVLGGNSIL